MNNDPKQYIRADEYRVAIERMRKELKAWSDRAVQIEREQSKSREMKAYARGVAHAWEDALKHLREVLSADSIDRLAKAKVTAILRANRRAEKKP